MSPDTPVSLKQPYKKPEFRIFGDLNQLTRGNVVGGQTDADVTMIKKT